MPLSLSRRQRPPPAWATINTNNINYYGEYKVRCGRDRWLCPVDRGISEEVKAVRSRLRWMSCWPPRAMVMSGPGLLLKPMSGSVALLQLWSVLMPEAATTTEGQEDGTAQNWPFPSLTRTGLAPGGRRESWPCPHQLPHLESAPAVCLAAQESWPWRCKDG